MTLEVLQKEMITAMKNHNKTRKDAISNLISAVKKAAIDNGCKDNITEELVDSVILKAKKIAQEMIDGCPAARTDLLQAYTDEFNIINEFAPQLLTDKNAIATQITTLLAEAQVECLKSNKGQIMKVVMPVMKGKADMKVVNELLGEMLK